MLPDDTHKQHIAVTQTLGCNPDAQHPTTHSNRSTSLKHIHMQAEPIAQYCGQPRCANTQSFRIDTTSQTGAGCPKVHPNAARADTCALFKNS